jgi:hypothetical protein
VTLAIQFVDFLGGHRGHPMLYLRLNPGSPPDELIAGKRVLFDQSGGQNPGTLSMSERIVGMSLVVACRIIFWIITEPSETPQSNSPFNKPDRQ